ncbi:MAG: calcium/sodium antiporter [Opitutaceae bacterium]|nr:calcium/sodium antiporter [Opitutaceae bacterium]
MSSNLPWLLVLAGLALLTIGGEGLVRGSSRLARRFGITPLVVGLTIVAFGTSSPELFVSVGAALSGRGDIAVGNVVGSNIGNIGCILAVCALIFPLRVSTQILRVDMPVALLAALVAAVVLSDGRLGTGEAVLLLAGLVAYTTLTVRAARREQTLSVREEYAASVPAPAGSIGVEIAFVAGGLLALMLGARLMVDGAVAIARAAGVSDAVIGLTIVAIGTSLPEFSASLVAAFRRQPDIAVGNIVGSNIFNILGILGAAGAVEPLRAYDLRAVDLGVMVSFTLLLLPFMKTGFRLQRWEGALLLAGYVAYIVHLVGRTPAG